MTPQEYDLLETLDPDVLAAMLAVDRAMADVLRDTEYTLGLAGETSCKRSAEVQTGLYAKGRRYVEGSGWEIVDKARVVTYCDGLLRKSYHQTGRAVDAGLRRKGVFVWDSEHADGEAHELFLILVDEMKARGFEWGGEWRTFPDRHHFQMA